MVFSWSSIKLWEENKPYFINDMFLADNWTWSYANNSIPVKKRGFSNEDTPLFLCPFSGLQINKKTPYKIQIVNKDNPELLDDGVILFHNPSAKYKIPLEMFGNTNITQISLENGKIVSTVDTYPIVARLNINKGLEKLFHPYIEQQLMLYNRFDMNEVLKHFRDNFI